ADGREHEREDREPAQQRCAHARLLDRLGDYARPQAALPRMGATLLGRVRRPPLVRAARRGSAVVSDIRARSPAADEPRLALGAGRGEIVRQVVSQALVLAAIGLLVGLAGAVALTRLLRTMLFEVSPTDVATFATVAIVLGAIAVAAGLMPARRASRVDPLVAL